MATVEFPEYELGRLAAAAGLCACYLGDPANGLAVKFLTLSFDEVTGYMTYDDGFAWLAELGGAS